MSDTLKDRSWTETYCWRKHQVNLEILNIYGKCLPVQHFAHVPFKMIGIEEVGMDAAISLCIYALFTRHYLFNSTDMHLKFKKNIS